jgi:hypothetical protein
MDATRGGQTLLGGGGGRVPEPALPTHAQDDAALRPRALRRGDPASGFGGANRRPTNPPPGPWSGIAVRKPCTDAMKRDPACEAHSPVTFPTARTRRTIQGCGESDVPVETLPPVAVCPAGPAMPFIRFHTRPSSFNHRAPFTASPPQGPGAASKAWTADPLERTKESQKGPVRLSPPPRQIPEVVW